MSTTLTVSRERALQDALGPGFIVRIYGYDDGPPPRIRIVKKCTVPRFIFWTRTIWQEVAWIGLCAGERQNRILTYWPEIADELMQLLNDSKQDYDVELTSP